MPPEQDMHFENSVPHENVLAGRGGDGGGGREYENAEEELGAEQKEGEVDFAE